jgi:hypothetical protein
MLEDLVKILISNPKRGDNYATLRNTVRAWDDCEDRLEDAIKATGNALSFVVAEGIKKSLQRSSRKQKFFKGAASKWSPSISQARSKAGSGSSVSGWNAKSSYTQTTSGGVYITTFEKRNMIAARCESMQYNKTTYDERMAEVRSSQLSGGLMLGISESIREHKDLIYSFVGPDIMSKNPPRYQESMGEVLALSLKGM